MEKNNKKSNIHFLIGVPGSGKSTYAEKINKINSIEILNPEKVRKKETGDEANHQNITFKEVYAVMGEKALELIEKGEDFIYDASNCNPEFRREILKFWREKGEVFIRGVLMITPTSVAKERNKKRNRVVPEQIIESMKRKLFNNPLDTTKDDFDEIWVVDKLGKECKIFDKKEEAGKEMTISSEFRPFK